MRKSTVSVSGKIAISDLSFFTEVKKNTDLATATATCRISKQKVPTSKDNSFGIVLKGKRVRF
ncbi:MAG: hypothetical protein WBC90_12925 [Albidovulum sp.]